MFKLQNPIIVIDLEATAEKDERGYQRNDYVIDIGAVILDTDLKPVAEFSSLVCPGETISPFIEKLTGITNAMAQEAEPFAVVGKNFENWVREQIGNPKKGRLAAWGNYFDIPLLRKNYQQAGLDFPFAGTALDVKTLAFTWLALSGRRTDKLNLEILAATFGIKPEGAYHRALTDAQVTAGVLRQCWHELEGVFVPGANGADPWMNYQLQEGTDHRRG